MWRKKQVPAELLLWAFRCWHNPGKASRRGEAAGRRCCVSGGRAGGLSVMCHGCRRGAAGCLLGAAVPQGSASTATSGAVGAAAGLGHGEAGGGGCSWSHTEKHSKRGPAPSTSPPAAPALLPLFNQGTWTSPQLGGEKLIVITILIPIFNYQLYTLKYPLQTSEPLCLPCVWCAKHKYSAQSLKKTWGFTQEQLSQMSRIYSSKMVWFHNLQKL